MVRVKLLAIQTKTGLMLMEEFFPDLNSLPYSVVKPARPSPLPIIFQPVATLAPGEEEAEMGRATIKETG